MPSSATASLRIEKPATGELLNTWGAHLDTDFDLLDAAVAGWATIALVANLTLSASNYVADQARLAMLKFTGSGAYTVTIPAVSKRYDVWNALTGILTISNGSTSVTLQPGEVVGVVTDGNANISRVQPTDFGGAKITSLGTPTNPQDAATKQYADNLAFTANAGILPGQAGNAGKVLTTDGVTTASWTSTLVNFTLSTPTITSPTVTGGQTVSGSTKQNVTAAAALNFDLSAGDIHTKSISAGSAFTFSNATAAKAQAFILYLTISSSAVPTWPAAVKWEGGHDPSAALGNGTHLLGFITADGGTTWVGILAARAVA